MTTEEKLVNDWIEKTYLDYVNNYLTIETMALNYNLSEKEMRAVVNSGREIFENKKLD